MLKTKPLTFILLCVATMGAQAATIEELVTIQREAMVREAQKKMDGDRQTIPGSQPQTTVPIGQPITVDRPAPTVTDMRLIGVFGKADKWTADLSYNGAVFTVKPGGEVIDGWIVEQITATRVMLRLKKSNKTQVLYLSEPATNNTTANALIAPVQNYPGQLTNLPSFSQMPPSVR